MLFATISTQAQHAAGGATHPGSRPGRPQPVQPRDPDVILLAPAHLDAGTPGNTAERDITLRLAARLRDQLLAHGFKVVVADAGSDQQQAELANRSLASACLLLHASSAGHGVHLYTSALSVAPSPAGSPPRTVVPWDTVQAAALPQSLSLRNDLATALNGTRVPLVSGRASVAPIDSLNCPAVAIELTPYAQEKSETLQAGDPAYQQRVSEGVVTALLFRRRGLESAVVPAAPHGEPAP